MHLGILQCGHVPDEVAAKDGPYGAMFARLFAHRGFTRTLWSVVDGDFPPGPDAAEAWLVTGSRHGAYEDLAFIPPLEALIRAIRDAGRPLVGICFGHQIIAQALGGRVEKFAGGWSVGHTEYRLGAQRLALNAWHQDQVTALPPGAVVHATSDFCVNAIMAVGPRILTVQAHPEFGDSVVEALMETRATTVPQPLLARARAGLGRPTDSARVADWLADVLEGADATARPDFARARAPGSPPAPQAETAP